MKNVHEIIQERIASVALNASNTFKNLVPTDIGEEMYRLGFTNAVNIVNKREKLDEDEVLRARLIRYFGCKILYGHEIDSLELKYNLKTVVAERFKDVIPTDNQKEIVEFAKRLKRDKLNHGTVETDLYHIPITTPFLITAPPNMFKAPSNPSEMTRAEYAKWIEEDPIVWKELYRFNPGEGIYSGKRNEKTNLFAMVSAWGIEATLINTN